MFGTRLLTNFIVLYWQKDHYNKTISFYQMETDGEVMQEIMCSKHIGEGFLMDDILPKDQ